MQLACDDAELYQWRAVSVVDWYQLEGDRHKSAHRLYVLNPGRCLLALGVAGQYTSQGVVRSQVPYWLYRWQIVLTWNRYGWLTASTFLVQYL